MMTHDPCPVRFYDETGEPHDCLVIEVNGNLVCVEDADESLASFEINAN